jgi:hypothetical protein
MSIFEEGFIASMVVPAVDISIGLILSEAPV